MTGKNIAAADSTDESAPRASDLRRAGFLLSFAGVDFLLVVMVLEAIYPGYSVHHNAISDLLAVGTGTSLIGEPMLFLAAVCWIAGAYYLFRGTGKTALLILNILPGTGLLLAVLSPENVNIVFHSIGAALAFIPGPIAAILSFRAIGSPFRYYAFALGFLSLAGTVVYFGAYETSLVQQGLGPGGWERVIVYPLLVWLIGFGSYLLATTGTISVSDGRERPHHATGDAEPRTVSDP
jgi:hypothetical membrane protein